jgi:hypothetical protein
MTRVSIFSGVLAAACLIGGGAFAQSAGSFVGTSADTSNISLTVTQSGSTYTVTGMSVGFTADCKHTGLSVVEGWGFFSGADISSGATPFTNSNDYYYITGTMHFSGHNVIKGTITSYTAAFVPGGPPPTQSQYCTSPKQAFTLTKQAAETPTGPTAPGMAVVLPKPDTK